MSKPAQKIIFTVRSAKGRIRNVSARPRLGQEEFRAAFADARPLGRLPGDKSDPLSLAAIGHVWGWIKDATDD